MCSFPSIANSIFFYHHQHHCVPFRNIRLCHFQTQNSFLFNIKVWSSLNIELCFFKHQTMFLLKHQAVLFQTSNCVLFTHWFVFFKHQNVFLTNHQIVFFPKIKLCPILKHSYKWLLITHGNVSRFSKSIQKIQPPTKRAFHFFSHFLYCNGNNNLCSFQNIKLCYFLCSFQKSNCVLFQTLNCVFSSIKLCFFSTIFLKIKLWSSKNIRLSFFLNTELCAFWNIKPCYFLNIELGLSKQQNVFFPYCIFFKYQIMFFLKILLGINTDISFHSKFFSFLKLITITTKQSNCVLSNKYELCSFQISKCFK